LNLAYNVVRAARFVAPERDIDTLFDEIDRGIAQHELDTHLRVGGQKFGDPFHFVDVKKVDRRRHAYQPSGYLDAGNQVFSRLLKSIYGRRAVAVELISRIGKLQLPRRSLHQPGAELLFQFLNAPADGVGRDP
jgi:hypothetical protein